MPKSDVLQNIREARQDLQDALAGLPDELLLRPFAVGYWSVKDALAHLTAWELELITALATVSPKRVPHIVEIEDIDEWNEEQYHLSARRPLDDVLADFENVHQKLLKMVNSLDNATLDDARRFPWMEGEPLWYLIAENGFWHEKEHAEDIRHWRQENKL